MLSSGVEPLLRSSVPAAVLEGLYLPGSGPAGRMALADPRGGPKPALARSEGLAAQLRGTTGVEDLCQEIKDVLTVTSRGPAEPPPEELLEAGGLGENEQNEKRHFRRLDCCSDGCQKEEEGGAEEHRAERCALAPGESWSKQEGLCLNLPEVKPQRTCHTEVAGPQKGTEESQANAQVTAETLPKLTEEVQGMKADGTRLFSKAGYRSDRVSKGLPPESNECPDVDTVTARAGLSETSTLDCLEPLEVMDIESATEHPQETNEYNGLKAHAAVPLRAGGNTVSVLETREEKLPRRNPVNEFRTPLANCQSYQQDEGNNAHDLCTGPVPNHNEPHRLSSVESCRTLSTKSSEALCSVLKSSCYPDFRNMPLENNSTTVHGFIDEARKKYLPKTTESQTHRDHGTGFAEHQTSTSIPAEQVSVVRSEGLPSAKADHREVSASIRSSYSSEIEEAAEDQRKTAVGGNAEGGNPEAQEGANSEHRHSSVSSSVASSPEEFSQEKLKTVLLEGNKVEKDPWRLPASDLCKEDMKENSLFIEGSDIPSHETGETHTCFCNASSKTSPPSSYGYLDLTKLEKDSPEAQLLEKESESKPTSEELAGSLVEATEANSNNSLFGGKETSLIYTLNVPLPPVAQKSREPHPNEHPPCTADEVPSRDKAWDNLSGKESTGATGTTEKQVTEIVLHEDKFKSSLCSRRTFDNPNPRSNISQKNMKSSVGNVESVTTASVNEHGDTQSDNNQSIKEECAPGSASCTLSGSARVDDVPPSSYSSKVEEKTEENDNLEGEASVGDNSQKVMVFPEAHFPLACGSLHCEGKWGSRGVDLHGVKDVFAAKSVFCSAHTAQKAAATLVRDEISIKNMEVGKQSDLCEVTGGSEIVCDRGGRKEQMGVCALQADRVGKIRAVDSSEAPEGNHRNKSSEQLSVRYLKKETCVDNFGFCHSSLWPNKRDLGTSEKKELPSPAANPSQFSLSTCSACPLLINTNIQTGHAGQTEKTLHPTENQCLACQSEFDGPVKGNKQHLGRLNNQPETGLQTMAAAGEEGNMSIGSSQSEKAPIEAGDDLPLLAHKYAKDSFRGTLKENVVDLDSLNGVRNEDCSGYVGFISDLIEEKTVKLKEHKSGCEREDKGTPEESFSDSKSHCSQHACFIKCAKENAELLFAGNRMQPSLPKVKWLVGDQENTVSTRSLPFSSVHGSLSHKPENRHVLSETETKKNLRVKSILKDSCPQLTFESGEETDAQECIGPSCFGKFDIQESSNKTQADSEGPSALNLGIALPEEEELWMLSENTQMDNCDLSSAKVFSKNSSVTELPGRKASNIETPGNEPNPSFLEGANSSRDCACSKNSLRERHSMLTVKDMDVTSPEIGHCGEKFKNTSVEEKVGREVTYRKKLPKKSFLDGADCLRALLEDSKESGSKIVPLSSEVLEEIPRSNLNNFSKEGENASEPTNLAGTCLLSEPVCDCQGEDVSDADPAPKSQCNTAPRFYPCPSIFSNSCKESSPNPVVGSEACVPYKLHAQSKDNIKEVAEGQDTVPTCSVCKENEALGSERLDQVEKHPVLKQKKYEEMGVCLSDKAQQEQKSEYQEKEEVTLQPSTSHRSDLLCSCSKESVTARNKKFDSPSEEIFAVRSSENKLCSTLEEVKRPKITTDVTSSQFLKTQDSEMENLNLNLGCDGIPGAFGTTNKLRGPVTLKRQPGRMCKKVPTSHQQSTIRKSKKIKSSPFSEIPPKIFPKPENALLQSLYFPRKPPPLGTEAAVRTGGMPRQGARRDSLLNSLKFRRCTKEPALLGKLSAMASKLLAPAKSIQNLEPRPYSSEILPVAKRCSQRRSKNLLEAFSCINRSLHSRWADSWCTKMFSFQPLALYPVESTKILISDLSHEPPTSFLDTPFFPISFHIKLDSSPVTDRAGITSQHSVHPTPAWGGMPAPPAEWTFSFLLSRGRSDTPVYKEYSSLGNEPRSSLSVRSPRTVALHPDRRRNALAERRGHCSMLGLHTVLALSSPGCYRFWTRRRNLTSHIPTIQRLFISQFAQGLKGARYPTSVPDDLVSSLPYSLGRALSIWSQHGPSARPSEITPLHSSHCKWQPSVGIENSYAVLPHFPAQSMEALQTGGCEIRLETSFPLPLPKSCALPESLPSPSRLPAPELRICALDEADASVPACLTSQDDPELKKIEPEKRPKKVSQIRIRKTVPKPDPNLTPMGLPKPKRLKKKEFSLEEIYTNKNYKSPPPARSLETIFEEPKEKNGRLISVSQQKRKRILEFQDFTLPRKRKTRGKIKAVGSFTRAKKAALQSAELDALLIQKLMDLEAFFATEEEEEEASGI